MTLSSELLPAMQHYALLAVQALVHGLTILLVLTVVLRIASRSRNELPRRVKLEPTIDRPRK